MRVKVHVEGIKGSGLIKKGEEASALFRGVLEVDGVLMEEVGTIEAIFSGDDFLTVKPHLLPGSFEVVTHTDETWPELLRALDERREIRTSTGRIMVGKEEE